MCAAVYVYIYAFESNRQKVFKCSVSLVHYNDNESPTDQSNQYPQLLQIISFTNVEHDFDEVNEQHGNENKKKIKKRSLSW